MTSIPAYAHPAIIEYLSARKAEALTVEHLRERAEQAERSLAAALARVEALREALLAYQDANRIHNDSEAERYAKGEAALASPGKGAETTTGPGPSDQPPEGDAMTTGTTEHDATGRVINTHGGQNVDAARAAILDHVREITTEVERLTKPGTGYDPETGVCTYCHGVGACPRCWGRVGIDRMAAERDALAARVAQYETNAICIWGKTFTVDEDVPDHLASCPGHPMRSVEAERDALAARLAEVEGALAESESATNHTTTRLSPSGRAVKERARALLAPSPATPHTHGPECAGEDHATIQGASPGKDGTP